MSKSSLLSDIKSLRILFHQKDKLRFAALFALMFAGSVLEAIGIGIIPGFVAFLMKPSNLATAEWLGGWTAELPDAPTLKLMIAASLILLGFMVFKALFLSFVYYAQNRIVQGFRVRLSCRMFTTYQAAPYEWLLQRNTSELQRNIINDVAQVIIGIIMPLLDLVMATLMTAFIVVAMLLSTSPITMLGAVIIGGGVVVVIRLFRKQLEKTGEVSREESKIIIQSIQQGFGALVDARIVQCEAYLAERFRRSITKQSKMSIIRGAIMRSTPLAIEVVAITGLLLIFLLVMKSSGSIVSAIPVMSVLGVATIRLKQVAGRVAVQMNTLNSSRAYIPGLIEDIRELESLARRRSERLAVGGEQEGGGSSFANATVDKLSTTHQELSTVTSFETLALKNVTYAYPNTETPAVNGVSLELKKGESIAFVGTTGCGKSTLVNLILGLLEPREGSISVNGADIFSGLDAWRGLLGYIPQTIFLLDDSIRANVAFGVPENQIDESRLMIALGSARLTEFVESLSEGLNTIVGERGTRLSGGQRQRIGIARALYFGSEVLVMDEATSALDNKTEAEVMEAIQNMKKGRTLIMIAHRLSTVEGCDRLYYLQDGQLIEQGTYDELIERSEGFRTITKGLDRAE